MSLPSKDLEELREDAERFANQLPRSASKDEALEIAIKAAETSMQALKLARDPNEKSKFSTRVKQLLSEAERIKQSRDWKTAVQSTMVRAADTANGTTPVKGRAEPLKEPQSTRVLSRREQIIVLKASNLNRFQFPPWTTPPAPSEFDLNEGEELFLYVSVTTFSHSLLTDCLFHLEIRKTYLCPSFKKMCSMSGSGHPKQCRHHLGFLATASILALA